MNDEGAVWAMTMIVQGYALALPLLLLAPSIVTQSDGIKLAYVGIFLLLAAVYGVVCEIIDRGNRKARENVKEKETVDQTGR